MIHHIKRPILYVDDTVEQRYAMRRILETEEFEVLEAGTGKEALELMKHKPALAVVDVKLPDINGYELARQLKAMDPYLPLLQVSASFSDPNLRASGLSGGADAYIAQPVHPTELISLIRRMLRTSEAEGSLRFLASIGPRISTSLSPTEAAENICSSLTPFFADGCVLVLHGFAGGSTLYWPEERRDDHELKAIIEAQSREKAVQMVHSRLLIAPLGAGTADLGWAVFELGPDREYTASDLVLAEDLANRASVALHNCMLFTSEQLARNALIQSEKLATAGRMAAAIAHEINNPLEALTNLMYLIERSPDASDSVREMATAALAEVMRLAHITRQSLGFYRELRFPTTLDLSQTVADALDLYRERIASKGVHVELELEDNLKISGIRGEIRQVISNLIVNALEAIDTRGKITILTRRKGNRAILSIADSGAGIHEDVVGKIFEPFFTTKQGTGTGLGLWVTQSIVEKHNGTIHVSSRQGTPDTGTTFEIDFAAL